jgi:hypothetical protein
VYGLPHGFAILHPATVHFRAASVDGVATFEPELVGLADLGRLPDPHPHRIDKFKRYGL